MHALSAGTVVACGGSDDREIVGEQIDGPDAAVPSGIAVGSGAVWVSDVEGGTLIRVDPKSGKAVAAPVADASDVAVGEGAVWVTDVVDDRLAQLDSRSGETTGEFGIGAKDLQLGAMGVGEGAVWLSTHEGILFRVDPNTGEGVPQPRRPSGPSVRTGFRGRFRLRAENPASSTISTRSHSRRSHSVSIADRCAGRLAPFAPCSEVLTLE